MSTTACSRPMNDVTCGGRLPGTESSEARRIEVVGQARAGQLEDPLGPGEVAEAMLAEIDEAQIVVERVARQLLGRERHEDLPALRRRHQARGAVDGRAVVVAVAELGVAGVHTDPHPQRPGLAPRLIGDRPLRASAAAASASCALANTAWMPSPVVFTICPLRARTASRRSASWRASASCIASGNVFPEAGRALEIGEEERHGSRRRIVHAGRVRGSHGLAGGSGVVMV